MATTDDLVKLRSRMADAVRLGVMTNDPTTFQAILISIVNDAERNRQIKLQEAQRAREQAASSEAMAQAFNSIGTIIYQVLDGYIKAAERAAEEIERQAKERSESLAAIQNTKVVEEPITDTSEIPSEVVDNTVSETPTRRRRNKPT